MVVLRLFLILCQLLFHRRRKSKLFFILMFFMKIDEFLFIELDSEPQEKERIPYKFAVEPTLPSLVVFNIDELIWPFKVDQVMTPPLKASSIKHQVRDRMGKLYDLFPEAGTILEDLFTHWYKVAGLVQSTDPAKIEQLMSLYDIEKFFKYFEVFPRTPGSKIKHMKRLRDRAEVPVDEILYFDTNKEDIEELELMLEKLVTVHVDPKEGITYKYIEEGFQKYFYTKNDTLDYHYALATTAQPVT